VLGILEIGFHKLFVWLSLKHNPSDLFLLSSWDYSYEPLAPSQHTVLIAVVFAEFLKSDSMNLIITVFFSIGVAILGLLISVYILELVCRICLSRDNFLALTIGSYYILTILIHPIHEQMLYLFRPYFH
jgi:hypothetical protein